jgi:DNA-binding response OmpR family regulator
MAAGVPTGHVVVIDDLPDLLSLYQDLLVEDGYLVTSLPEPPADPDEVLRLAPDLVVLDLVFGQEERGLPFLRRLRAEPAAEGVEVLVCTAATGLLRAHAAELDALGAATLDKPFDLDDLLTRAQALCTRAVGVRDRASAAIAALREAAERNQNLYRRVVDE